MKVINLKLFLFFLVFSSVWLSACSKYEVAYDFTPPSSKQGLACLSGCQKKLTQCNQQCSIQNRNCSVSAQQQAKKNLPGLKAAYPREMKIWLQAKARYESELDWYELQYAMASLRRDRYMDHCMGKGNKRKACHRIYRNDFHDPYLSLNRPYFDIPRPLKPTLSSETLRIKKVSCSTNCGCEKNHRLCYASCGGVVKSKKVCVKNCN